MTDHEFRIIVGGMVVAGCSGTDPERLEAAAMHYALQYLEDGPVRVEKRRAGGRWRRHTDLAVAPFSAEHDAAWNGPQEPPHE